MVPIYEINFWNELKGMMKKHRAETSKEQQITLNVKIFFAITLHIIAQIWNISMLDTRDVMKVHKVSILNQNSRFYGTRKKFAIYTESLYYVIHPCVIQL